jgi:superoxide oxidase
MPVRTVNSSVPRHAHTPEATVTQRYSNTIILLHWCTAILVILSYALSEDARRFGNDPPLLHFSFGLSVLVLTITRLGARVWGGVPPEHSNGRWWLARCANIMHAALYLLLIAVPLSGWYLVSRMSLSVSVLGWTVPALAAPAPARAGGIIGGLHQIGGNLMLVLAGLHGMTALWHQFALKDGIFRRMSPFSVTRK